MTDPRADRESGGKGIQAVRDSKCRRILIVEDDEFLTIDLEITLTDEGFEALTARTVSEALCRIAAGPLDGALLDVNLFGLEKVFSVADALVAVGVPFVFITGRTRAHLPERFRDTPMVGKPYHLDEVLGALAGLAKPRSC